ncbi:MAG: IQ calmodulin-binding motif-containing protein [Bryobacteraceae bacterium]
MHPAPAPLLLADRPWAEIEKEQRARLLAAFVKPTDEEPTLFERVTMGTQCQMMAERMEARLTELTAAKREVLLLTDRPWSEIEAERRLKVQTGAATSLQTAIRGFNARKLLEEKKEEKRQNEAATTIQSAIRAHQARIAFEKNASAIKIQSAFRGMLARRQVDQMKADAKLDRETYNKALRKKALTLWKSVGALIQALGEFLTLDTVTAGYRTSIRNTAAAQDLIVLDLQDWNPCMNTIQLAQGRAIESTNLFQCLCDCLLTPLGFKTISELDVKLTTLSVTCEAWDNFKLEQTIGKRTAFHVYYTTFPKLVAQLEVDFLRAQCLIDYDFDVYPFFNGKIVNVDNGSGQKMTVPITCTITIEQEAWETFVAKDDKVEATVAILKGDAMTNTVVISEKSKIQGQRVIKPEPEGWCVASGGLWRLVDSKTDKLKFPKTLNFDTVKRFH